MRRIRVPHHEREHGSLYNCRSFIRFGNEILQYPCITKVVIGLPADCAAVWRDDVSQRPVAVLGATDNREDVVAASRWDARSLDDVYAVLPDVVVGGLFLRPGYNGVDKRSQAGDFAHRSAASFSRLLAASLGKCRFDL